MNYLKIYESLIKSRIERGEMVGCYGEWHHIQPRCVGGSDDPENLVWLTPREHFLAHLLLAFIYGGKLWAAAKAATIENGLRKMQRSRTYEIVHRKFAELKHVELCHIDSSSTNFKNKKSLPKKSEIVHAMFDMKSERFFTATTNDLLRIYGLSGPEVSRLVSGKRLSAKNLCMAEPVLRWWNSEEICEVVVRGTGKLFRGTWREIYDKFHMTHYEMLLLAEKNFKLVHGISLVSIKERTPEEVL